MVRRFLRFWNRLLRLCSLSAFLEGPEGVKWELGLACFCSGKMGFKSLGLGFGRWEWEKNVKNGNGINIL